MDYRGDIMKSGKRLIILIILLAAAAVAAGYYFVQSMEANRVPTISLTGDDSATRVYLGTKYKDPGYTATDTDGKDITAAVKVKVPDMNKTGKYVVRYSVKDSAGRTASASRIVRVVFAEQTKAFGERGLAVLMYHKVYDEANPPAHVDANCISSKNLESELKYLVEEGYYFPTWKEVREYVDGKIDLPKKSVVLTFDDGSPLFIKYGIPLIEKYDVRATSFVIASRNGKQLAARKFKHLTLESHSYDMHRPGGKIGHGGIFTALTYDQGLADLKKSIEILGNSDAFAYPFGDYTKTCEKAVKDAGFLVAFTTGYGKIHPGDDPYLLTRVRVNGNISLAAFKSII